MNAPIVFAVYMCLRRSGGRFERTNTKKINKPLTMLRCAINITTVAFIMVL